MFKARICCLRPVTVDPIQKVEAHWLQASQHIGHITHIMCLINSKSGLEVFQALHLRLLLLLAMHRVLQINFVMIIDKGA